jgi:hypothetical protein
MSAVKRTRDVVDILEHAMQGVHTSENQARIRSFRAESGIVGVSSRTEVRGLEVPEWEQEVIVSMPDRRAHRR